MHTAQRRQAQVGPEEEEEGEEEEEEEKKEEQEQVSAISISWKKKNPCHTSPALIKLSAKMQYAYFQEHWSLPLILADGWD